MLLYEFLIVADLVVALLLIGFVLIQQGKGADMGASFGGGGSNTVFGASGSGNFMTRTTAILATLFFLISLALGNMSSSQEKQEDEWQNLEVPVTNNQTAQEPAVVHIPSASDVPANDSDVPAADAAASSESAEGQEQKESDVPD